MLSKFEVWDVYLRSKLLDSIYYIPGMTAEQVRRGLIDHDGYDSMIRVQKRNGE